MEHQVQDVEAGSTPASAPALRIALVRPPLVVSRWSYAGTLTPPLGLAYVAAALEGAGHTVVVIDAIGEDPERVTEVFDDYLVLGLPAEEIAARVPLDTQVVGVTCMFSSDWPYTRQIIAALRAKLPDALFVAGGEHVTATPTSTLEEVTDLDCIVLGEGEEIVCELVSAAARGIDLGTLKGLAYRSADGIVETPRQGRIRDVDTIACPAWHLVPVKNYIEHQINFGLNRGISMPVLASRGCPFQCTFCSNPQMWTTKWSARDPELLLDEIESYMREFGAVNFDFYDLTAIVNRKWILQFAAAIKRRGLKFSYQLPSGTRSEAIDKEVAQALVSSGCVYLAYSPESGSSRLLREIKKNVKLDNMLTSMRASVSSGILVKANMIMGLPGETRSDLAQSLKLIARMALIGVSDVSIAPFAPYPGSELYDRLNREAGGKLSTDEFYLELSAQTDLTKNYSWNEWMSPKRIAWARVIGHAVFYAIAMVRRPWRVFVMLAGIFTGKEATVLDKSVRGFVRRQAGRVWNRQTPSAAPQR